MPSPTREFVTLLIDNRRYAIERRFFHEAQRPGPVTPLPFVPDYIEGLVNIDGRIATCLDLGRLFAENNTPSAGTAIALVETGRSLCALRVQAVLPSVRVADSVIEGSDREAAGDSPAGCVMGRFFDSGQIVEILDAGRIGLLVRPRSIPPGKPGIRGKAAARQLAVEDSLHVLVCSVAEERYGFAIEKIIELVEVQPTVPVPGAPDWIAGIGQVRGVPFLMTTLQGLLQRPVTEAAVHRWIVMVEDNGLTFGVLLDDIAGIQAFTSTAITPIPHPDSAITAVLENRAGELVMLVDPQQLVSASRREVLQGFAPDNWDAAAGETTECLECLAVAVADERFVIPLSLVSRIVQYQPYEQLDTDARHVLGVIDVDGRVVPVVNANPDVPDSFGAWSEYIVMEHEQAAYAVRVSATDEVISLPVKAITASSHAGQEFVSAVAHFGDNLYSMFNPEKLKQSAR